MRHRRRRLSKAGRRRRQRWLIAIFSWLIIIAITLGGIAYLFHLGGWRIQTISIMGAHNTDKESIKKHAKETLSGSYWLLIPKDNALFYPYKKLRADISQSFPRIADLSIEVRGMTDLEIRINERDPYARWCIDDESKCFLLDQEGFVFASSQASSSNETIILEDMASSTPRPSIGVSYFPEVFEDLANFINRLPSIGFTPQSLVHQSQGVFRIIFSDGRYLLVDTDNDFTRAFDNLQVILNHNDLDLSVSNPESFSYIDLRFGNRIFYMPGNAESLESAQAD